MTPSQSTPICSGAPNKKPPTSSEAETDWKAHSLWHAELSGADLALQAAALAHGIAEGQHFIEGNKRVALAAMLTFLRLNGYDSSASQSQRADWILRLSEGMTVSEFAAELRVSLLRREGRP